MSKKIATPCSVAFMFAAVCLIGATETGAIDFGRGAIWGLYCAVSALILQLRA